MSKNYPVRQKFSRQRRYKISLKITNLFATRYLAFLALSWHAIWIMRRKTDTMQKPHEDTQQIFHDIDYWREETRNLAQELNLYTVLLANRMIEKSKQQYVNYDVIFDKLDSLKATTVELTESLIAANNNWDGIRECDDMQCENHFINEYAALKLKMDGYLADIQLLKKKILTELLPLN